MNEFVKTISGTDFFMKKTYWNGRGESEGLRKSAAKEIFLKILKYRKDNNLIKEPILVLGHSHGGNVAIQIINLLDYYYNQKLGEVYKPKMTLITLNTPKTLTDRLQNLKINHYNIFATNDVMSPIGQAAAGNLSFQQKFDSADINIDYKDQQKGVFNGTWNHIGFNKANFNEWRPKLDEAIKKMNEQAATTLRVLKDKIRNSPIQKTERRQKTKQDKTKTKSNGGNKVSRSPRYFD